MKCREGAEGRGTRALLPSTFGMMDAWGKGEAWKEQGRGAGVCFTAVRGAQGQQIQDSLVHSNLLHNHSNGSTGDQSIVRIFD